MEVKPLSQRDPLVASLPLGTSSVSIGQGGCTITCLAMRLGLSVKEVNDRLNAVGGFAPSQPDNPFSPERNLVDWTKLSQAFPGIHFVYRYYTYYDAVNTAVLDHLPCLVEVDASKIGGTRHWVLYIGNHMMLDPWDGKEKPTSTYEALGAVILDGALAAPKVIPVPDVVTPGSDTFMGLDLSNRQSMEEAVKVWHAVVVEGKYMTVADHNAIITKVKDTAVKQLTEAISPDDEQAIMRYQSFKTLGYTTVDDVKTAIQKANEKITKLLQDMVLIEKKNADLADTIAQESKNSYTAVETALDEMKQNKELKESIAQIAEVSEADKPTTTSIVKNIFQFKELAKRFMEEKEKKQKIVVDNLKPVKQDGTKFFMQLFQLTPRSKEVK